MENSVPPHARFVARFFPSQSCDQLATKWYTDIMEAIMNIETLLKDATRETIVFVKYTAGRTPTHTAVEEAKMASDWGHASDEFVGHFESLRRTKKGDLLLTLFVHNRGDTGRFRAFNPTLGHLQEVRILTA